jgi:hypothetical protein
MKKKLLLFIITIWILYSCNKNGDPITPGIQVKKGPYSKDFETIWKNFDTYYVFFNYKGIDWKASYNTYATLIAKDTVYDDFIGHIDTMLAPLKDVHVWIKKKNGQFIRPYFPNDTVNWDYGIWQKYMTSNHCREQNSAWGWFKNDSVGYIYISSWDKDLVLINEFDAILDSMRNCKGIIFDIRMNGGGYGPLAGEIGGRFVADKFSCGYIQYRNGKSHDDFTSLTPLEYPKRGDWQFTKPVVLLIGKGCFSTSEIFAAGMTKLPNCTTIGDTTGGGLSNGRQFSLADGTTYSVSDQLFYDTEQNIVELNGIRPQVKVHWDEVEVKKGKDLVLEFALEYLSIF